jgi:hypothetical protein
MPSDRSSNWEAEIEDHKRRLGIDEGIVEDGRAMGIDITPDYVKRRFDPGLAALFRKLAPPPPEPPPREDNKEGHDASG